MTMRVLNDQARTDLLSEVVKAIEASNLTDRQKRVAVRKLTWRPKIREMVLDEVISQSYNEGLIVIDPIEGDVQAQIDWEGLIGFIERLIPLIIQLIGLFG